VKKPMMFERQWQDGSSRAPKAGVAI